MKEKAGANFQYDLEVKTTMLDAKSYKLSFCHMKFLIRSCAIGNAIRKKKHVFRRLVLGKWGEVDKIDYQHLLEFFVSATEYQCNED